MMLEVMAAAKHLHQVQIVNGLAPGNVLRALRGERRHEHPLGLTASG